MRVPTLQRTQRLAVISGPKASGQDPVGQATQKFAGTVMNIGSLLQERVDERKRVQDAADSGARFNLYRGEALAKKTELESLRGADARQAARNYTDWHKESEERFKKDLNPDAAALFAKRTEDHYYSHIGAISGHQAREEQAFNQATLADSLNNTMADVMDDPFATAETEDGDVYSDVERKIEEYHLEAAALMGGGYNSDIASTVIAKIKVAAITGAVMKDPDRAESMIDAWKKDIGPQAYKTFKAASKAESIKQLSNKTYDAARTKTTLNDAEDYINSSPLPVSERRQLLSAIRVDFDRREQKRNEIKKEAHDAEESNVADMIINNGYVDAFKAVREAKNLTGPEKMSWLNAIRSNAKADKINIDPSMSAREIVTINRMISMDTDPTEITNYITKSEYLKKDDKEQYINKVQTKISAIISEGRKRAYKNIEEGIIPKRSPFWDKLLQTDEETKSVERTQRAFDDWLNDLLKKDKPPTMNEMREKGEELGSEMKLTMSQKMDIQETEAKRMANEMKEFAKIKSERKRLAEEQARQEKRQPKPAIKTFTVPTE